jgi:ADP-ribose pyrophosphatase YjhB (NUDIX family)
VGLSALARVPVVLSFRGEDGMSGLENAEERFAVPFVKALVLDRGREAFLLQRRTKAGDPYVGFWELPGGKIRRGETHRTALGRELAEEAGVDLRTILDLLPDGRPAPSTGDGTPRSLTDRFGRTARLVRPLVTVEVGVGPWPILGHYFACLAVGDPRRTEEADGHRWIGAEAFGREFLESPAPSECATLDLLALTELCRNGALERILRGAGEGAPRS